MPAAGGPRQLHHQSILKRVLIENARVIVNQSDAASRHFLQRVADVLAQFRDIEGRKTVVMFSEGFFQDNLSRELETVAVSRSAGSVDEDAEPAESYGHG